MSHLNMFSEGFQERKERETSQWTKNSQPRSASVPGYTPLHQRRRSSDLWNGLLWQPKYDPSVAMSAQRQVNGHLTPPRDADDFSMNDEVEIILPASTRLRNMINHSDKIIVAPGVYDGLSARVALSVGFEAMYMACYCPCKFQQLVY